MKDRLHGLDLIRLVSFFAIATFHVSLVHYHTRDIAIAADSLIIRAVEQTARVLAFSGFTICFLSCMLTSLSGSSLTKRIRLFSFLILGWAAFSAVMIAPEDTLFVWDIYPLIFVGVLICSVLQKVNENWLRWVGLAGFVALWIPWWEFGSYVALPADVKSVLGFGDCLSDQVEWPILPWMGLVFAGYAVGVEFKKRHDAGRSALMRISGKEAAVWGVVLAASTLRFGDFYAINLGGAFACEAYRQPPFIWWSHFAWPLALMRLSFDPRVQGWLAGTRFARFVSGLAVSRKFWLAYFTNYMLCYVLSYIVATSGVEQTSWNVPVIAFIAVFFLPLTEVVVRGILWAAKQIQGVFSDQQAFNAAITAEGKQRGISLMVVMMSVVTVGATVSAVTLMVRNRIDQRVMNAALAGRQTAFEQTKDNAASAEALRASMRSNAELRACIKDDTGVSPDFSNCNGGPNAVDSMREFTLLVPYAAATNPVTVATATANVAGAQFTWRGIRGCTVTDPSKMCVYRARVYWWPECKNRQATCKKAERIYVLPRIEKIPGARGTTFSISKVDLSSKLPSDKVVADEKQRFKNREPLLYASGVLTSEIYGQFKEICDPGMVANGTQENGSLKCACDHGYKQRLKPNGQPDLDEATGYPKCDPIGSCPEGRILIGIDENGQTKCVTPEEEDYICDDSRDIGSKGDIACAQVPGKPGAYRMRKLKIKKDCYVLPKDAPANQQYVDCGDMQITCCRLKPK